LANANDPNNGLAQDTIHRSDGKSTSGVAAMTTHTFPTHADTFHQRGHQHGFSVTGLIRPIVDHASAWISTCADYMAAAATYEQLSRLSDTDLHRHGLSRANLAREICESFESARSR
jgi:hypothetical protein